MLRELLMLQKQDTGNFSEMDTVRLDSSIIQDITKLSEWIQHDPYHKDCLDPLWWLTGQGFLSYKIQDDEGITMYVRTDKEDDLLRLHVQFAPGNEVSKKRVVESMLQAIPKMELLAKHEGLKGLIYKSTNPSLIKFLERKGFQTVGNDDHLLRV